MLNLATSSKPHLLIETPGAVCWARFPPHFASMTVHLSQTVKGYFFLMASANTVELLQLQAHLSTAIVKAENPHRFHVRK